MIMSFLFIALSAALGVGMWFLVIGIVFSIGGGDLFIVTHYDSLFFISKSSIQRDFSNISSSEHQKSYNNRTFCILQRGGC